VNNPINRDKALQPLSREHHQSLLLCWKIRIGFRKNVEVSLIKSYVDWFYKNHVQSHFELEEKHVFSILGKEHELVKRALAEYRKLRRLFKEENEVVKNLGLIEEKLEAHIRFEERILFNEIQKMATRKELKEMELLHMGSDSLKKPQEWKNEFWK
jgi:hemerythrin-like domain-containing protein